MFEEFFQFFHKDFPFPVSSFYILETQQDSNKIKKKLKIRKALYIRIKQTRLNRINFDYCTNALKFLLLLQLLLETNKTL